MGKKHGEKIKFEAPAGKVSYHIVRIH